MTQNAKFAHAVLYLMLNKSMKIVNNIITIIYHLSLFIQCELTVVCVCVCVCVLSIYLFFVGFF